MRGQLEARATVIASWCRVVDAYVPGFVRCAGFSPALPCCCWAGCANFRNVCFAGCLLVIRLHEIWVEHVAVVPTQHVYSHDATDAG